MNEEIRNYAHEKEELCVKNDAISDELYGKYGVNRGLRDINGKGVLTGLTTISKMVAFKDGDGVQTPCGGELWYRGYNAKDFGGGRKEVCGHFVGGPLPADKFHARRYYESTRQGYYELDDEKYPHACFLRPDNALGKA